LLRDLPTHHSATLADDRGYQGHEKPPHVRGFRWLSALWWTSVEVLLPGLSIRGAHPCALPLRGQLRRYAAPLFTFGFPE